MLKITTNPNAHHLSSFSISEVVKVQSKCFGLGFIPEGEEARKITNGPMVPGPWAYAYALPTVVSAQVEPEISNDLNEGDIIEINGHSFTVAIGKNGNEPHITLQ